MSAIPSDNVGRRWHSGVWWPLWAVCVNTITMTMRRRAAAVLLLFVVVGAPVISLFAEGDNTLVGLLRLVVTYNFTVVGWLLMLMLLYLSATVLDRDLAGKQIFLVDVKPLRRWQLLAGKWLGLVLLSGWLLLIMTVITYVVLVALAADPSSGRAWVIGIALGWILLATAGLLAYDRFVYRGGCLRPWSGRLLLVVWLVLVSIACARAVRAKRPRISSRFVQRRADFGAHKQRWTWRDLRKARDEFFLARVSCFPARPDIASLTARYRARLKQQGRLDEGQLTPGQLAAYLRRAVRRKLWSIDGGQGAPFTFERVPDTGPRTADVTVRYKFRAHAEGGGDSWLTHGWEFHSPRTGLVYRTLQQSKKGKTRTFNIPGRMVAGGGRLQLVLANLTPPNKEGIPPRLYVPMDDGIELLVGSGAFWANLLRASLLLWIRLAMIAAVGIAANTFLQGSVAAFLVFGVLAVGMGNTFVYRIVVPETFEYALPMPKEKPAGNLAEKVARGLDRGGKAVLPWFLRLLPNFDDTDPVPDLVMGRRIPVARLLRQAGFDLGLRAGLLAVVGMLAFYRKEVGLPVIV